MPVIVSEQGFNVVLYFNDHDPPHAHIKKAGGETRILLGDAETEPSVLDSQNMPAKDIKKSLALVILYQDFLLQKWEEFRNA
ncbi:MAG: DUF4160 domain-containing protein [Synechococcales cyanobacterium CRU_2_2]|nr:DUF4160 domain-containing protein [Synechococcales cyanobacterium CRU_2_2]